MSKQSRDDPTPIQTRTWVVKFIRDGRTWTTRSYVDGKEACKEAGEWADSGFGENYSIEEVVNVIAGKGAPRVHR